MIIGAIIIGIFILALITLGIHISKECDDSFDIGVFIGIIIAILMFIEICLFGCITEKQKPSALDVYRGNTSHLLMECLLIQLLFSKENNYEK